MSEHYFTQNPTSTFRKEKYDVNMHGFTIHVNSGSGIFSIKELDFGTNLLINNNRITSKDIEVLDLGSGYGIIGMIIKKLHPSINIHFSDINDRAIQMTKLNLKENAIEGKTYKGDIFANPELNTKKFDVILTNPPFSAGKSVCLEFIRQSFDHLNTSGSLQLVAPHNKGGESLKKYMKELFGNVDELAKKSGFRVYISVKK